MKTLITQLKRALGLSVLMGSVVLGSGPAQAEKTLDSVMVVGAQQASDEALVGTIDRVEKNGSTLLVDDTLVELAPVVVYNGNKWSRERLVQALTTGDRIQFALDPEHRGQTPVVISIQQTR